MSIISYFLGLPSRLDIALALALAIGTVIITAILNRLIPGSTFSQLFNSITSLFIVIVSMFMIVGAITGEISINVVLKPVIEIIMWVIYSGGSVILNGIIGVADFLWIFGNVELITPPKFVFVPVNLQGYAKFFADILVTFTGTTTTTNTDLIFGATITSGTTTLTGGTSTANAEIS